MVTDIFFVEDDEDFSHITILAIDALNKGLNITIVPNGKEALESLALMVSLNIKPKMILLDLSLPGMSGLEILKSIKEMVFFQSVPVILFTTSESLKDVKASVLHGADGFEVKPLGYLNLIECLGSLCNRWLPQISVPS